MSAGGIERESVGGVDTLFVLCVNEPSFLSPAPSGVPLCVCVPLWLVAGMFIVILPWVDCPIIWCIYNIILQMIGNIWLVVGLVVVAYQPMVYCIAGSIVGVSKPMDEDAAVNALRNINTAVIFMSVVAAGTISYGCWELFDDYNRRGRNGITGGIVVQHVTSALKAYVTPMHGYRILTLWGGCKVPVHHRGEHRRYLGGDHQPASV